MKKFRIGSLSVLVALLSLTSCLERQMAEDAMNISVDRNEIVVPSDLETGRNLVKDTLWLTCNRNWVAEFEEFVDWVSIDTAGRLNLAKVTEKVPILLSFLDNEAKTPREVKLRLSSEAGKQIVTVRQQRITCRLSLLNSPEEFTNFSSVGDSISLKIKSNTDWALSLAPDSELSATFSKDSGKYSGEVTMYVAENYDLTSKTGTLVLSSPDCDTVKVALLQESGKPYVKFPKGNVMAANDGLDNFAIPIKANASWTASVLSVSGYDKNKVSVVASGTRSDTTALLTFPASLDFSKAKATIKVKFQAEGAEESAVATIEQAPAIRYIFGDPYSPTFHSNYKSTLYTTADTARIHSLYWPFATYKTINADKSVTGHDDGFTWTVTKARDQNLTVECTTRKGGYVMHMCGASDGISFLKQGFGCGAREESFLGAPIVPGRKLVKVSYWIHSNGSHGLTAAVMDMSGNKVTGGSIKFTTSALSIDNIICNLTGTTEGTEYKIGITSAGYHLRTNDVTFYYE